MFNEFDYVDSGDIKCRMIYTDGLRLNDGQNACFPFYQVYSTVLGIVGRPKSRANESNVNGTRK